MQVSLGSHVLKECIHSFAIQVIIRYRVHRLCVKVVGLAYVEVQNYSEHINYARQKLFGHINYAKYSNCTGA